MAHTNRRVGIAAAAGTSGGIGLGLLVDLMSDALSDDQRILGLYVAGAMVAVSACLWGYLLVTWVVGLVRSAGLPDIVVRLSDHVGTRDHEPGQQFSMRPIRMVSWFGSHIEEHNPASPAACREHGTRVDVESCSERPLLNLQINFVSHAEEIVRTSETSIRAGRELFQVKHSVTISRLDPGKAGSIFFYFANDTKYYVWSELEPTAWATVLGRAKLKKIKVQNASLRCGGSFPRGADE